LVSKSLRWIECQNLREYLGMPWFEKSVYKANLEATFWQHSSNAKKSPYTMIFVSQSR